MTIFNTLPKVVLSMMFCSSALANPSSPDLAKIFERPLILGASVSGDFLTASPGKRLSLRYTDAANITTFAKNGRPGRETLSLIDDKKFQDRTVIIGVDLFFWDSLAKTPEAALRAMDRLLTLAKEHNSWLIVGQIPRLMPRMQVQAEVLNVRLQQACAEYSQCRILPLSQILQKVIREGGIEQGGRHYDLPYLLPDGLHISTPASEYLADRMAELI